MAHESTIPASQLDLHDDQQLVDYIHRLVRSGNEHLRVWSKTSELNLRWTAGDQLIIYDDYLGEFIRDPRFDDSQRVPPSYTNKLINK